MSFLRRQRAPRKVGLALAIASTLFLTSCGFGGGEEAEHGLEAGDYHVVAKEDVVSSIVVDGSIAPVRSAGISTTLSVPVEGIHVKVGDRVEQGQLLVTMDTSSIERELEAQRQAEAEAQANAESAAWEADQQLAEFQAQTEQIPGALPEEYAMQEQQLQAQADAAHGQLDQLGGMGGTAQLEYQLGDREIYSPMAGVITNIEAEPGAPATGALMSVADNSRYLLKTSVRETDISNVREGNRVTFTTPVTGDKQFEGKVRRIAPMADGAGAAVDPAGAAARAMRGGPSGGGEKDTGVNFPVEVEVTGDTEGLRLGGSARVEIITEEDRGSLSVPRDAVYTDGEGDKAAKKVLVVARENEEATSGTIEERTVKTGISNDTDTAVTGGDLEPGDVVIAWPDDFRDRVGEDVDITDEGFSGKLDDAKNPATHPTPPNKPADGAGQEGQGRPNGEPADGNGDADKKDPERPAGEKENAGE